ncbi:hypothetical protein MTO96_041045 [Rhipicephalus appendiculatus]
MAKKNANDTDGLPASICLSVAKCYMITAIMDVSVDHVNRNMHTLRNIDRGEHGKLVQLWLKFLTSTEANARKLLAIKRIRVNGKEHEVAVYAAAEGNYNNGVIRKVERDISDADLVYLIVHPGNPTARGAKRIGETGSVIILFDGEQVPSYTRMGPAIVRCYIYKKQFEVCSKCTRVGHRADVCPTPMVNVCRNCGAKDPAEGHSCQVRCKLCGKGHPTGDKTCRQRYQTPFVVRQRRKEREIELSFKVDLRDFPALEASQPGPPSGGWLQPFSVSGGPALPTTAKWASQLKHPKVTNKVSEGTATKESEELKRAKAENAKLGSELAEMKKEMAALKTAFSQSKQDGDQNGASSRKRRAVGEPPTLMT